MLKFGMFLYGTQWSTVGQETFHVTVDFARFWTPNKHSSIFPTFFISSVPSQTEVQRLKSVPSMLLGQTPQTSLVLLWKS